jgi:DNA mismatch repair protein MutL
MSIIKILPEHIANQIAAGEVVTRPASAVKELLENSVDAGASEISLYVEDAGKTLIRVIDNGAGMTDDDARNAFLPHATSKIKTADDLLHIATMGFRGEALASIASVSQIELKTKTHSQEVGTQIEIDGGTIKNTQQAAMPAGTSISVKNIYYNTPARRKFLSSDEVEYKYIEDAFTKIALAHPEIFFSLYRNNTKIFSLPKENLHARVIKIFGNAFQQRLVKVSEALSDVSIEGYICKPEFVTKTRNKQYLFVNKRIVRHTGLNHAIESAFANLIPEKTYPLYCIFIEVDPSTIDVNIHPAKTEIRFNNEKLVYSTLHAIIKHAIGIKQLSPTLDFSSFQIPTVRRAGGSSSSSGISQEFREAYLKSISEIQKAETELLQTDIESLQKELPLYDSVDAKDGASGSAFSLSEFTGEFSASASETNTDKFFQVAQSYIVSTFSSGLLLIDQQAASERILFDEFCQRTTDSSVTSKQLLFPQSITLSVSQTETLKEIEQELKELGWDFSWLGDNSFMINAVPAVETVASTAIAEEQDLQRTMEEILDAYIRKIMNRSGEDSNHNRVAAAMAKRMSVKHGKKLHNEEISSMIHRLFSSSHPHRSPSGKATFKVISAKELAGLLG